MKTRAYILLAITALSLAPITGCTQSPPPAHGSGISAPDDGSGQATPAHGGTSAPSDDQ